MTTIDVNRSNMLFRFETKKVNSFNKELEYFVPNNYKSFYEVYKSNEEGDVALYLAYEMNTKQWHVWYKDGNMYSSYGTTMKKAVINAVEHLASISLYRAL
jgi:hypothetical protein